MEVFLCQDLTIPTSFVTLRSTLIAVVQSVNVAQIAFAQQKGFQDEMRTYSLAGPALLLPLLL